MNTLSVAETFNVFKEKVFCSPRFQKEITTTMHQHVGMFRDCLYQESLHMALVLLTIVTIRGAFYQLVHVGL